MALYEYRAVVVKVVDADTVDLHLDLGIFNYRRERVRLYGINAYEMNSPDPEIRALAKKGKDFVINITLNQHVHIKTYLDKGDKYGRLLATIYPTFNPYLHDIPTDLKSINDRLVELGLAVTYFP